MNTGQKLFSLSWTGEKSVSNDYGKIDSDDFSVISLHGDSTDPKTDPKKDDVGRKIVSRICSTPNIISGNTEIIVSL